jgi:hypothetical protein
MGQRNRGGALTVTLQSWRAENSIVGGRQEVVLNFEVGGNPARSSADSVDAGVPLLRWGLATAGGSARLVDPQPAPIVQQLGRAAPVRHPETFGRPQGGACLQPPPWPDTSVPPIQQWTASDCNQPPLIGPTKYSGATAPPNPSWSLDGPGKTEAGLERRCSPPGQTIKGSAGGYFRKKSWLSGRT